MPLLTPAQDKALVFLSDRYGDVEVHPAHNFEDDHVKLVAVDEDGDERARWIVRPDGKVAGAWDPDEAINIYYERGN
jgi:hypothetical protein